MLYQIIDFIHRAWNKVIVNPITLHALGEYGVKVILGRKIRFYGIGNLHIGNDVSIGDECLFMCTRAKIFIGDHTMFGPRVTMITGGHRTDIKDRFMSEIGNDEKLPENDQSIILEGDSWIGANAIILKGVTIHKGAVVAAGAVVTHDVPEYSLVGGVPANVIRTRFKEI